MYFAYVSGIAFILVGAYLSYRRRRVHPLLLLSISALSFSWIESPYDWAMYAQFPPGLPRMPSWWPLNVTWGGRWLSAKFNLRRPITLLTVGLLVGFCWAFVFNAITGAHFGNFYYGYVIPGLAIFEGTKHQYPLYDSLAMGIEMMVFTYLLGRTDAEGRNVIEMWADTKSKTRLQSSVLSIVAVVVVGHLVYGSVFAPHLITKLGGWVTAGPTEQLFPGTPNQPR